MNYLSESLGQKFADRITSGVGSWPFICVQSTILLIWIVVNGLGLIKWDPYPFILLNLGLSFQAAYTAPFILMSQGRQSAIDRRTLEEDLDANKQELMKLDEIEIRLTQHIEKQIEDVAKDLTTLIKSLHQIS